VSLGEADEGYSVGSEDSAHLGQRLDSQGTAGMGQDRLRKDEVEPDAEQTRIEIPAVREMGLLDVEDGVTELMLDAVLYQPVVWLDAVVAAGIEVGNQEAPSAERAAAQIKEVVVRPQPHSAEKCELG
jgi:hypothetical protein